MKLSVVIPCLNEAQTIEKAIGLAQELVKLVGGDGEVVIGDNGSTDASREIASRAGARIVPAERRGYGYALLAGIRGAKGDVIVMGDADATYDFREAAPMVESVYQGECDLAMGSRLRGKIEKGAMPFLHRYLGTPVLTALIRYFFGLRISDCNCGMRAFSREAFERMHLIAGGMEFASEMIIKAALVNLHVKEYPISLAKDQRNRTPHLHTWRDGWRHLRFILLMAPQVVFEIPGWSMAVLFGLWTLVLSLGPVSIAGHTFDYHHLFYSLPLFFFGLQTLWFHAFAVRFRQFTGLERTDSRPVGRLSLESWLLIGGASCLLGLLLLCHVFVEWWSIQRGALFAVRRCTASMAFIIFGLTSVMNAMIAGVFELTLDSRN